MRKFGPWVAAALLILGLLRRIVDVIGEAQTVNSLPIVNWVMSPAFSFSVFVGGVLCIAWLSYETKLKKEPAGFAGAPGNKKRYRNRAIAGAVIAIVLFVGCPLVYGHYHRRGVQPSFNASIQDVPAQPAQSKSESQTSNVIQAMPRKKVYAIKKTEQPAQPETGPPPAVSVPGSDLLVIPADGSSQVSYCNITPDELRIYITLIEEYQEDRPSGIGLNNWINEQLEAQKEPFRIPSWQRPPSFMDNVNINGAGATELRTEGRVIMEGGSVTNGKVGIENNCGYVNLNGTKVSDNEKNIVNDCKQEEKEPVETKPRP